MVFIMKKDATQDDFKPGALMSFKSTGNKMRIVSHQCGDEFNALFEKNPGVEIAVRSRYYASFDLIEHNPNWRTLHDHV